MAQWFIKVLDETKGPFTASEIRKMAASGELKPDYWIRKGTSEDWKSAQSVKGIEFGTNNLTLSSPAEERATRYCPYCAEEIYAEAKKCKHCGEFVTAPSGSLNELRKPTADQRILDIAQNQKYVIYVILAQFVALVVSAISPLLGGILILATLVLQLLFVFKLCMATFAKESGVILGILSLVPILGLLVLLIVNSAATKILKSNGIPVGFLGVPETAIQQLTQNNRA